jgi:hypothetical protein
MFELLSADDGRKSARFKVRRWQDKAWREKEFEAEEGAAIGALDPATGVDFRTGATVVRVTVERTKLPRIRKEIAFDDEGKVVIEEGRPKTVDVTDESEVATEKVTVRRKDGTDDELVRPRS